MFTLLDGDPFACFGDDPEITSLANFTETMDDRMLVNVAIAFGICNFISDQHEDGPGEIGSNEYDDET